MVCFWERGTGGVMSDQEKLGLLVEALEQVKEDLDGFVDVEDGNDGPVPNWAMRIVSDVDRVLAKARVSHG